MDNAPLYSKIAEGPANGRSFWIHADDMVRLRVGLWKSNDKKNGTVFVFPGRTGYIERYGRIATWLSECGLASFAIDWRGHGLSERLTEDRNTCHVGQFSDYQRDVDAMINAAKEFDLPKPWYLIGNSMGACIGLRAILEGMDVAACAFIAPMWAIKLSPVQHYSAWALSWAAQAAGKGHVYAPGYDGQNYVLKTEFVDNSMTNDPEMYRYFSNQARSQSDLLVGGPSMGWLFQSLKECQSLSKMSSPDIPCITFCGAQDEDIDIRAVEYRMARWTNGKFELIQSSKHDVLHEIAEIRQSVMSKICDLFTTP